MMQEWFKEAKLGIFIHYGIYSLGNVSESWSFHNGAISYEDYMKQCEGFTASKFDAKAWADLFKRAGAQYVVLTSKHHDGVALFDTKYSDLSVVKKTPAGRDLIKEYTQAVREAGMKVGLYYSLIDWSDPRYRTVYPEGSDPQNHLKDVFATPAGGPEDPEKWQEFLEFNNSDAAEHDHTLVRIVDGVKDQCLQRIVRAAARSRNFLHDGLQHFPDADTVLRGNKRCILRLYADHIFNLILYPLRIGAWKVDLINNRKHVQIVIQRQIDICKCLRLNALGCIHHKDPPVAGCQGTAHLIVKIHMARRVYQVENILISILRLIDDAHGLGLDRNTPLPLQFHIVQYLCLHLTACQKPCLLDDPIRQRGLTVIYVGNDTKISDFTLIHCTPSVTFRRFGERHSHIEVLPTQVYQIVCRMSTSIALRRIRR